MISAFIALTLAAAVQAAPAASASDATVYKDEYGCKWKRKPKAAQSVGKRVAASASQPHRRTTIKPVPKREELDEFIGCDPEGFAVFTSDLQALGFIEATTFDAIAPVANGEPASFQEECACSLGTHEGASGSIGFPINRSVMPWPGGGGYVVHVPAVPEPSTWLMMLSALMMLMWRRRKA
jgi:hypothetical protein